MTTLLLVASLAARHPNGAYRIGAAVVAVLTAYNVLNIETGRTGYLQVIAVSFIFVALSFSRLKATIMALTAIVYLGVAYLSLNQFSAQMDQTLANKILLTRIEGVSS